MNNDDSVVVDVPMPDTDISLSSASSLLINIDDHFRYDGIPLDMIAVVACYDTFATVFAARAPISEENIRWCFDAALGACNIDVVVFLLEHGHVSSFPHERLFSLCLAWSDTLRYPQAPVMCRYLMERGVDFVSPIGTSQQTLMEQFERDGMQRASAFLNTILTMNATIIPH